VKLKLKLTQEVRTYLSWPEANLYLEQAYMLRRPCVSDEDTTRSTLHLATTTWVAVPQALLDFSGRLGLVPLAHNIKHFVVDLALYTRNQNQISCKSSTAVMSSTDMIIIWSVASVWAFVILVVVVVLFVRLKTRKT
jgi:hypothetical protein